MSELYHGGALGEAISLFGGERIDWLDLSTGINPFSYPVQALDAERWQRLPDADQLSEMLEAARETYLVPDEKNIVAANGTQAIIERLPQLFTPQKVSIVSPTYGEHAHVWKKAGYDVSLVSELEQLEPASIGVVVNPNNPDAKIVAPERLIEMAGKLTALIVDEAFCDCFPELSSVPTMTENMFALKSFGKFFGLAGLRLGFAICAEKYASEFHSLLGPWSVSGPAIAVGTEALADQDWIVQMRKRLMMEAEQQSELLESAGLQVGGVNPLFIYGRHEQADELFQHLARRQILVRNFPENPKFLRFGLCKDKQERQRLIAAVREFAY